MVPGYVIAQFAGAFVGAVLVYVLFAGQFEVTKDQGTKLGVFCTGPSIANTGLNLLSEIIGTFVLVLRFLESEMWKMQVLWDLTISSYLQSSFPLVCHLVD